MRITPPAAEQRGMNEPGQIFALNGRVCIPRAGIKLVCGIFGLLVLLFGAPVWAQQAEPLPAAEVSTVEKATTGDETTAKTPEIPDLITLKQALELANSGHPALLAARAKQARADAGLAAANAGKGWSAKLSLQGRLADRVLEADAGNGNYLNDSRYELAVSKLLYDFADQGAAQAAAEKIAAGSAINLDYQARLRRVEVMARYLDVVAADYQFAADNEAMTLAFFPWNRARERRERFQSESEVEVLKLQTAYQKVLAVRNDTQRKQRKARFKLATALGWPDAKPVSVLEPDLSAYTRPLPDYDELVTEVLAKRWCLMMKVHKDRTL